jgi:hypothetical protein
MSGNPFWIHDPGSVTVCDEYVYALIVTLERSSAALHSSWVGLAPRETLPAGVLDIPSLPPVDYGHARAVLGTSLDDLSWLRSALVSFAEAAAAQERARVLVWGEPAERALALWVAVFAGADTQGALGHNPVSHAARSVSQDFPRTHEVVVREEHIGTLVADAPQSVGDRVSRIPLAESPIRIERYFDDEGQPHSEVYIAGTSDWGVGSTPDPFDMQSNIALVAGLPAASLLSVRVAMTQAGIRPGERVTFTGHSQGGAIATRLAESGRYQTTGLLVVGSPTGTLSVDGRYPAVALRHTDDVVPRVGGSDRGSGFTTVERASGRLPGDFVGAHEQVAYADMARDLDASPASPHLPEFPTPSGTAKPQVFSARRAGG